MRESLCLIPAKGTSMRLPRKNILPLNGKPLITFAIEKAIKSNLFEKVCVSTEDSEIANISKECGAEVPFTRPSELSSDPSTIVDVMIHALNYYKKKNIDFQQISVLLPTAPFVTLEEITKAHSIFDNSNAEALMSVTPTDFPPYNSWLISELNGNDYLTPCFPNSKYRNTKSTECPKAYRSNGAILIVKTKELIKNLGFQNLKIIPFEMPVEHSLDIDTSYEYMIAKLLFKDKS